MTERFDLDVKKIKLDNLTSLRFVDGEFGQEFGINFKTLLPTIWYLL